MCGKSRLSFIYCFLAPTVNCFSNDRQVDPETLKMIPRCLLVGHTAPILCISKASILKENNFIVTSSEAGEMCTWDLVDGKCKEVIKFHYVHTNIQVFN